MDTRDKIVYIIIFLVTIFTSYFIYFVFFSEKTTQEIERKNYLNNLEANIEEIDLDHLDIDLDDLLLELEQKK